MSQPGKRPGVTDRENRLERERADRKQFTGEREWRKMELVNSTVGSSCTATTTTATAGPAVGGSGVAGAGELAGTAAQLDGKLELHVDGSLLEAAGAGAGAEDDVLVTEPVLGIRMLMSSRVRCFFSPPR